jgi:hypothetical protein
MHLTRAVFDDGPSVEPLRERRVHAHEAYGRMLPTCTVRNCFQIGPDRQNALTIGINGAVVRSTGVPCLSAAAGCPARISV